MTLTAKRLRDVLDYEPKTGWFRWKKRTSNRIKVGDRAGLGKLSGHGYRLIGINGRVYRASRLAFFWMTGQWPKYHMDHVNLDRMDDRWINLRQATRSQNQANHRKQSNNTSGFKGVTRSVNKWTARATFRGKTRRVNGIATPEEAAAIYDKMAREMHGEFARAK